MTLWSRKQPTPTRSNFPTGPVVYPAGTCVHTENGYYLINKDGKKYRITYRSVLDSWRFHRVVESTEAAVSRYPIALTQLPFRDGSLLTNIADGRMYVVSEQTRRHITSPAVLERLGVTKDDFVLVSDAEINLMRLGEEIN